MDRQWNNIQMRFHCMPGGTIDPTGGQQVNSALAQHRILQTLLSQTYQYLCILRYKPTENSYVAKQVL